MSSRSRTKKKKNLVLYFQVHQPIRPRTLRFFDIGTNRACFDDDLNREIIQRVATQCYLPANALLLKLIRKNPDIKVSFSISGVTIDQFLKHTPGVIDSFRLLAETGSVDFLTETYYHSLASIMPGNEFELQAAKHQKEILRQFGVVSQVFRNTELIYDDQTGTRISKLGFKGTIVDGVDRVLGSRSPHHVFTHPTSALRLLTRDYHLSDDISFRFRKNGIALSADQYMKWLANIPENEDTITLAMDYETFGEHQKKETGIFSFLEDLLSGLAQKKDFRFMTASEAVEQPAVEELSTSAAISWADQERDVSAWLGNEMQRDAFDSLVRLQEKVKNLHNKMFLVQWRTLQTSDHFYYMSTKRGGDGEVHSYFSPYPSPYEAFINYMNILADIDLRIKGEQFAASGDGVSSAMSLQKELSMS